MGKREDFERFVRSRSAFKKEERAILKAQTNLTRGSEVVSVAESTAKFGKMGSEVVSAAEAIAKLDQVVIEDQSELVKYRQNITVPAVWLGEQGIRVGNIPQIPVEKIYGLGTYISNNVTRIDGGDLDAQ